ncbi:hypothetical protein QMK98_30175, partial [Klebsiella pneumoniae]|uniref:hypothetical protein n=1 Tax=Klebsiella pneumoniae TaxID=573 RepID=UPI003A885304
FTALAVVPIPRDLAQRFIDRVDAADDDLTAGISTPMVNALVGRGQRGRAYLLVGTVPADRLEQALAALRAEHSRFNEGKTLPFDPATQDLLLDEEQGGGLLGTKSFVPYY